MARKATNLAEVKVYINGKAQAEKELKELQAASDGFANSMERARNQMEEASEKMAKAREEANKYSGNKDSDEYKAAVDKELQAQTDFDEAQKKFIFNEKEWKKYQRLIKESEKLTVDLETALQHLSEQDIATLKKLQRQVDAVRNRVKGEDDPNKEFLNQLNEAFNQIADTIKNKKGDLIEFSDIVKDLTNVDDTSLAKAEQRLRSLLAATDKDDVERIKQLKAELEKTVGERQRRVKVEAQDVQQQVKDNKWKGTIEETQRAIKLQEEYKQSLKTTDAKSLKAVEETIDGLNKKLEAYQKKQTTSVLKNLDDSSYTQIQATIEHAKKLQQAAKPDTSAWNNYGKQIANATLYLEKWNDQQKRTKMVEISKQDLGKLSEEDLKQSLRYWDGMVNGIGRTNIAVEQYRKTYARFQEENAKRANKLMTSVEEGNLGDSIGQVQKNLKTLQEFRLTINPKDEEALGRVDAVIEKLKQNIKETESGFMSFEDAMKKAQGIMSGTFDPTLDDLEQIQKILKEGMQNKFHIANPEDEAQLKQTLGLMEEMLKKQKEVMRLNHQDKVNAVSGKLDKVSPAEIEEAVKAAKELQQVAKTKEEFIQLGEFIGKAEARLKDWNETSKQSVMKSQIKDLSAIRALSDGALQDQLKFWEGTMNAAKKTSTAYKEAKKNFEDLQAESKRRLQFEGEKTISDVKLGVGDGSTKQMQERLKLLQDYRAVINGTKPDAYKAVDEAILKLTEDIKASQAGFLSFDKALERAKQISEGTFKPTLEDLEQIQKVLKEGMQSKFNLVDDADIDQLKETRRLMDEMAKKQAEADRIRLKDQAAEIMGGDYTKTIEGTKQAIELLKKYQDTLDTTNPDAINEVTKSINKMKEELESASRAKAAEVMADPTKFSADEINEAIKLTEKLQAATNNATVWEDYEQQLIKAREARDRFADDSKYNAMVKQFEDLEDLTANAWAEQKKYWEAMRDSGKHYDEAIAKLKEMQELETSRMKESSTKTLTTDLLTAGTGDIKQSVEWLTKYQASLEPLEEEWTDINNLIKAGEERLKSITETVSKQNLSEQAGKIMGGDYTKTIEGTKQAIEILKKYQQTLDATDTTGLNKVEESIKSMSAELDKAQKASARKTLTADLNVAGTADIKQAVDWLTKYQGTLKPLSPLWKMINKEIEAGNNRLKELSDSTKMTAMTEQFKKYKDLSVNALAEQKKYWTEVKNTYTETDSEYKKAVARLDKIDELEKSRTKAEATPLITEATSGSWDKTIEETEKAIKLIQEYKKQLHTSTDAAAITDADKAIEALNANLKKGKEGLMDFGDAIAKAKTISGGGFSGTLEDLEKLQKAIKEGINTKLDIADPDDIDRLKEAQKLLEDIAKEQQKAARARLEEQAKDIQTQVKGGTYKGTIEETEKAIELQRQYMKLLDTTDAAGIKEVEDTIEALQQKLKQAKNELMSYKDAMAEVDKMNKGTWRGTLEDLEKIKKSLEYHKKNKLEVGGDSTELKNIEKALREIEKTGRDAHMSVKDIDELLKHLDSASVEQLTIAAKELQDQLQDAVRGTQEYAETAAKLREVNLELKKAKKEWEGQENVVARTAKRLMAYVAVYGGFNEIMGKMKEMVNMNLQLSDSMTDVQKTTGLTGVELQELGRSLERIDTRTTTVELYQLAAAAGQIGLKTQEDVLGFAKAANTISVALSELGAEGSASLMKIATLTGEVERYGTEQALTRVGSAINELTANSAATAGPIADFISRVGGIASASKMAIHEMAALGAASDASAQSIEIAGTSMNKFITALVSNTENIAYATNLNAQELQSLINEGNTMQAVVRVLESMQTMDRGGISVAMKELGSEGARMNQYIASMVSNLDMLKAQLALSKEAFEENVSVLNEYNVKQESALGILQRMKNSFMDTFVNSKMTVVLKDILQTIAAIPHWLEQHRLALLGVRVMIASIIAFRIPFLLNALAKNLWGLYGLLSGPFKAAMVSFNNAWVAAAVRVEAAGMSINGFTGKLRVLWAVIKANPLGLILTVATAVGTALWHMREETDKVAKATAELTKKHTRQIEELQSLRNALEATNTSYAVKAAAMKEINSLYSKYLGFELSELDNYEKKKAALDYINAKLKENQTLEMANRQKEVYTEKFNKDTEKDLEGITEALMSIPEIGANRLTEAMAVMHKAINEGATTTEEVMKKLSEHFKTTVEFDDDEWGWFGPNLISILTDTHLESLESYIEKYSTLQQQLAGTDEYFNSQKLENQRISDEALEKLADEHKNKLAAIESNHQEKLEELQKKGSAMTEAEQIAHLQALLKEQEQYQKTAEKMLQRAKEKDEETISRYTNKDTKEIDLGNMHAKYGDTETGHIVSSRVRELNDLRAQMAKVRRQIAEDEKALNKATEQLRLAEQKKNNEEEVQAARAAVEEKKKAINDGKEAITRNEMKWNAKYAELQTWATSDARKKWGDTVEEIGSKIRSLQIQIASDPWGKAFDLKDWKQFPELIEGLEGASVTSLVQGFEKLRDNTKLITQDVDAFNKMFDLKTPLKDLNEVNTQVYRWLAQIRGELKKRGRNTTGAPIFTNAKEELDLVLKNLQTHFLKRQKEIREAYIQGSMTSEEMDRQLAENDRIFVNERIELRKLLLGENSKFMKELYPSLAETDLPKLRLDLEVLGDEVTAELRKDLEEDENLTRESAIKIRKAIEQELIAGDPFGTLRSSFRSSLDQLMLMSSQFEREMAGNLQLTNDGKFKYDPFNIMGLTQEEQERRLDFLIELSEKSYTIDRDGLREMFESHGEYYNWVKNLDDEQMAVMLNKLQWFYDESLIKQNQYKERVLKGLESAYLQQDEKMDDIAKLRWKINKATADRDSLVEQNKAYEAGSGPSGVTKQQYDSNIQEIESRNQAIKELEEKLQDELDKASKKRDSKRRENERKAKEDMEASISALEAYYNEQEALIRKRGLENGSTQATIDRELRKNTLAAERDLIELRKKLLGQASTFDPNANGGYKGAITETIFFGENKTEEMLQKQAEQIKIWGKALTDGMRNQIAKGEITIQEALQKQKDKIEKILLEDDFSGKVMHEYAEAIDELGLLFNVNETLAESDEELGKARLTYMREWSKDAYAIDAAGLEERIKSNELFSEWVKDRSKEDYEALLVQLRKFNNDVEEADKKAADRRKKIFDNSKKGIEIKNQGEANEKKAENDSEMWKRFQGLDLVSENAVDRAQIELYQEKIQSSMLYIDQIKMEMMAERLKASTVIAGIKAEIAARKAKGLDVSQQQAALLEAEQAYNSLVRQEQIMTLEAQQNIAEQRALIADTEMSIEQRKIEKMKQYTDAVVDFAGKMTEAEWEDVESRKEAGRELIKTLLTLLKNQIQIWTTELVMKKMFAQQSTQATAGQVSQEATLQGMKTTSDIAAGTASATAKEAGSKGWIGLAVGAAIGAALSALLGLAMNAINKTKSTADSMAGTGRKLSTGMLTYAEGNYPVLGDDGKVYDAKYEGAGMKTGVYGGGAHFGIFSEKQPEMIVDGKTTQKIILNYPYIYDAITTIAKNGRLKNAMPTFAAGDYPAGMKRLAPIAEVDASAGSNEEIIQMRATMDRTNATIDRLSRLLENGISAHLDGLENYRQQKKNERFLKRRGID